MGKLGSKQTTLVKIFEGSFKILGDLHGDLQDPDKDLHEDL